jgi:Tol biopolymer transport system component
MAAAYAGDASGLRAIAFAEPPAWIRSAVLTAAVTPAARTIAPLRLLVAAALLVGLTIGAALIAAALLRQPTPLASGPLIVYQIRGDFADIYTLDVASGGRTPLGSVQLNAPVGGQRIRWAADGGSALVFGDMDRVQAQVDVTAGTIAPLDLLDLDGQQDEVSPDGRRVARLVGDAERGMRLSVVDLGGTELENVPLPAGAVMYSGIEWAPDGRSVLLGGCLPCAAKPSPASTNHQHLFLVPLDRGAIRQLTDDTDGLFSHARFSPDGATVAYSTVDCSGTCEGGIATVRVADGHVTQLTTVGPDVAPAWSPEGDRIALQRGGGDGGIFIMDRDGSNVIRLTTGSSGLADRDRAPVWSPDGGWIAFTRDLSDTSLGDLWIVPSGGGDARMLVRNAVADWGPTATMIAVVSSVRPTTSPSAAPSTPAQVSTSTSPASTEVPAASGQVALGGGSLLVFQVDGTRWVNATTMSVLLVDVETGQARKLGTLPLTEATCCPESVHWSADRQRVFLSSELGLQAIVDVGAGSVEAAGAAPPGQFVTRISWRGDRIARIDQVSGRAETIVISDLAGQEVRRLSVPGNRHVEELAWSPDDGSLAVIGSVNSDGDPDTVVTYLSVVPVDGSPARDLADNAAEVAAAPYGYVGAAWSPDGKTIALADRACDSSRLNRIVNGVEIPRTYTCAGRLLMFDVASGEQTVVMHDEGVPGPPSWSPDGTRLAFGQFARDGELRDLPNCYPCDAIGLFVIDRDGEHLTRLADGDGPADWSPDGTRLVFPRYDWELPEDAFRGEVWVVPAGGGEAKRIAEHAAAGW